MNKELNERLDAYKKQQQEKGLMETSQPAINPEANETKTNSVSTESNTKVADAPGEKKGVFDLVMSAPKYVYDKAIIPAWNFVKGTALKIKDKIIGFYESERELMKQLGTAQYLLDRGGKIAIGLLKIGATVTFAYFLSVYAMSNFGIALFSPTTLLVVGVAALVMIIAKSILSQRESGAQVSASQVGAHIVEAVMAA